MDTLISGSINEEGFIKNLLRKGFNMNRGLSEILQNCIDAGCSIINCIRKMDKILISDGGKGMTKEQMSNMWDTYRENHLNEQSGGVSGLGSKPSTLIMSQKSLVVVYTKSQNDNYIKASIPWNEIFRDKVYSKKIKIDNMSEDEIEMFKLYQNNTGTIIEFNYNHDLFNCLKTQFCDSQKITDITQRSDWIFSQFPQRITFKDNDNEKIVLNKYNYFSGHINDYYALNVYTIEVFKMSNDDIVYAIKSDDNKYSNFIKNNRGWQMDEFIEYRSGIKIGTIIVKCGMRKDDEYFDCNKPNLPGASKVMLNYDSKYFSNGVSGETSGDEIKASLWYPHVTRNGQNIGLIKSMPTMNPATGRSNGKLCLSNNQIRTNVIYHVDSSQTNIMDELFGIQENKNQLNSYNIDEKFLRAIEEIMKRTANEIWSSFQKHVKEKEKTDKHKLQQEKIKKEKEEKERKIQEQIKKEKEKNKETVLQQLKEKSSNNKVSDESNEDTEDEYISSNENCDEDESENEEEESENEEEESENEEEESENEEEESKNEEEDKKSKDEEELIKKNYQEYEKQILNHLSEMKMITDINEFNSKKKI